MISRSRRSATRSVGPQSPPKRRQPASNQSSPQARRSAQGANRASVIENVGSFKTGSRLSAVKEEFALAAAPPPPRAEVPRSSTAEDPNSFSSHFSNSSDEDPDELDDLDRSIIVDNLPALYQDAIKLLSLADRAQLPASPTEVISQTTSSGRLFKIANSRFQASLEGYRRDEGFISVERISRKVAQSPSAMPGSLRPDAILHLANCAVLLSDLVLRNHESKLELLANTFPGNPNESSSHLSATPVDLDTIDLAISLRTQYFLSKAAEHDEYEDLDVSSLLEQAFYDEEGQLLGFENHDASTLKIVTEACRSRIEKITSILDADSSDGTALQDLSEGFPWETFVADFVAWLRMRKQALQKEIENVGGPEAIARELLLRGTQDVKQILTPGPQSVSGQMSLVATAPAQNVERMSSAKMSKRMQQLKKLRAHLTAESDESDSLSGSATQEQKLDQEIPQSPELDDIGTAMSDGMPLISGDVEDVRDPSPPPPTQGSVAPSQRTAMILKVARRQAAQSNKENVNITDPMRRFTDQQATAKRVGWDDNVGSHYGKRRRNATDDEGDDDDDNAFEFDTREHKRNRVEQITETSPKPWTSFEMEDEQQQAEVDDQLHFEEERHHRTTLAPSATQPGPSRSPLQARSSTNSRPPPSSAPVTVQSGSSSRLPTQPRSLSQTRDAVPTPAATAEVVNRVAKETVRLFQAAAASDFARPQPQIRRPWSIAETNRLMDMIGLHGTAWSLIMQEDEKHPNGPELQDRGQVALKDKARNIKMDYLKACRPLPEGFAIVSIKATDMARLDGLGIPHLGGSGGRGT